MLQNPTFLDFFSLLRPIRKPKIWFYLAYTATINEYRRTLLGPLWILLSLIIFSLSIGFVYSELFSIAYFKYVVYMTTGMIAWNWASAILISSGLIYVVNSGMLLDHPVDKAYLVWSHAMSQLIIFLHQVPLVLLFYVLGAIEINANVLYIIPSLVIVFIINIGVAASVSILVTRYRDIHKILSSLVVIIMITTPIFWSPEMVSGSRALLYFLNPFYYIVEIIRDPLLGNAPSAFEYLVASMIAGVFLAIGAIMHKKCSRHIVFRL